MEDSTIVQLYWDRSENAIPATAEKYGAYCTSIARNILGNREDAEECVNDTWLGAWNAMPPHRPSLLSTFLGKITRNLSFNRYQYTRAEKRGRGELPLVLEELGQCVSGEADVEGAVERRELLRAIDAFLADLPPEKRSLFLCRYWYTQSVAQIARSRGMRKGAVSTQLYRLRLELKETLEKGGFTL